MKYNTVDTLIISLFSPQPPTATPPQNSIFPIKKDKRIEQM